MKDNLLKHISKKDCVIENIDSILDIYGNLSATSEFIKYSVSDSSNNTIRYNYENLQKSNSNRYSYSCLIFLNSYLQKQYMIISK